MSVSPRIPQLSAFKDDSPYFERIEIIKERKSFSQLWLQFFVLRQAFNGSNLVKLTVNLLKRVNFTKQDPIVQN